MHDVVGYAHKPIDRLEAWIAGRLNAATVDGYRRRRGELGALQRPRPPKWLAEALGNDGGMVWLATQILVWVGNQATAGPSLWPTESWAAMRSTTAVTAPRGTTIEADIDTVLRAMREHPAWYASYVERPLGRKLAPVARTLPHDLEPPSFSLVDIGELEDSRMRALAYEAMATIQARIRRGEPAERVVCDVIQLVFGGADDPRLDQLPHAADGPGDQVVRLLQNEAERRRIVAAVLAIATSPDL